MHILTKGRVVKVEEKGRIRKFLCKHDIKEGDLCSNIGLLRISGKDILSVCIKCGKVFKTESIQF